MLPIATDIVPLQFLLQLLIISTFHFLFTKFKLEKNVMLPIATDIVPLQFFLQLLIITTFHLLFTKCQFSSYFNSLRANSTEWSHTLKQFVGNLPMNCLNVSDHFVGLALKGLSPDSSETNSS